MHAHALTAAPPPPSSHADGAYYDFYAYEPDINSKGVVQDILEALAESFRNGTYAGPPLPVKMLMLDAYWMWNQRSNGNCKLNDSAWPLPLPRGLRSLADATGLGLILYNGPQCVDSSYAAQWPLVDSLFWDQGWGSGVLSAVAGASSRAFYDATFASLKAQGMAAFTQDFLDFQSLLFPAWLQDAAGNAAWMRGQADAALAAGLAVQCALLARVHALRAHARARSPALTLPAPRSRRLHGPPQRHFAERDERGRNERAGVAGLQRLGRRVVAHCALVAAALGARHAREQGQFRDWRRDGPRPGDLALPLGRRVRAQRRAGGL